MKKILNHITIESIYTVLDGILTIKFISLLTLFLYFPHILPYLGIDKKVIPFDLVQSVFGFLCAHNLMSGIMDKITTNESFYFMNQPLFKILFTIFLFKKRTMIASFKCQKSQNNIDNELSVVIEHNSNFHTFNFQLDSFGYDQSLKMVTLKNIKLLKILISEKILELNPAKNVLKTLDKINN